MTRSIAGVLLLLLLLLHLTVFAVAEQPAPTFQDYSVSDIFRGNPVAAQTTSAFAHRYRTVIREGARKVPNFSGQEPHQSLNVLYRSRQIELFPDELHPLR